PGLGVEALQQLQPGAQPGGLTGTLVGAGLPLLQPGAGVGEPAPRLAVLGEQGAGVGEAVEELALPCRGAQPQLVGLSVDGDEVGGEVGEEGLGHAAAPGEGPGAALRGQGAGEDEGVVVERAAGVLDPGGDVVGDDEGALDDGAVGPGADHAGVPAAAEEQVQSG